MKPSPNATLSGELHSQVHFRIARRKNAEYSRSTTSPASTAKGARLQTITMLKGGLKVCEAFNDARGCRDRKCQFAHVCDVKGCGSKDHNRLNHLEQA